MKFVIRLDNLTSKQNLLIEQELRKNEEIKKEIEKNRSNILNRQVLQDRKKNLRRQKEVRSRLNFSLFSFYLIFEDVILLMIELFSNFSSTSMEDN